MVIAVRVGDVYTVVGTLFQDVPSQLLCPAMCRFMTIYRGADKSLARPGRKQARKHVRPPAPDPAPSPMQGKAPKEIHAILTETLACFLPGQAKDLSAPL